MTRTSLLPCLLLAASTAHGFSVGTVATTGCHERITLDGLRAAGAVPDFAHVTAADRTLLQALPFTVEGSWDRATLALLIGIRDNDFHGVAAADFAGLSEVHFSPALQHEHCLRSTREDGAAAAREALARCRAFIVGELRRAAYAAPGVTERAVVALTDETTEVELPASSLHLGRALHALQDSFAHSMRSDDLATVRSVFNYVDPNVGAGYSSARDGQVHLSEYDGCEGGAAGGRAAAATRASAEVISALENSSASPEARLVEAELALDRVWHYTPACEDGAAWCASADAMLAQTLAPTSGCSSGAGAPLCALALLSLLAVRRSPRRGLLALGVVAAVAAFPTAARADEASALRLRPSTSLGLSVDRGAGVLAVGLRLPLPGRFELFTDVELNPWFDLLAGKLTWGALNAALGASLRWATVGAVELRTGVGVGFSLLLHDTVSAQAGAVGPFVELSVINVLFQGPGSSRFELRPDAVLTIPSLRGIPLVYHQYRMVLTLRFD